MEYLYKPFDYFNINQIFQFFKSLYLKDQEFEQLESRIPQSEMAHLIKPSVDIVKKSCNIITMNVICGTILALLNQEMLQKLIMIFTATGVLICFKQVEKLISKFSEHLQIAILIFNGISYLAAALVFPIEHKGHFNAFISSVYMYHFYLATLTPSKRNITTVIFISTAIMHIAIGIYRLGEIDADHLISVILSIRTFDLGLDTNQTRISQMYHMILDNIKLANEKQKVVQQFPHPVLILPQKISEDSKCYSNDQFESKIKALDGKIQRLDRVQVAVKKNGEFQKNRQEILTLLQYLEKFDDLKQNQFKGVRKNTIIRCKPYQYKATSSRNNTSNNQYDKIKKINRNFNIKSLSIEWKDVPSVMHVFIDTTDIINLEQAKNRIKMQKIMFASASHEFRTPLNAIINSFEIINVTLKEFLKMVSKDISRNVLQSNQATEHISLIQKFIKTGSTSSVLMISLVEDILNLSKIDNGTFTTKFEFFQVSGLLHEVHSLFEMQCESKGVDLLIECDDALLNCEVRTDRNRIRQVLLNLVSNSSKFTFRGFIKIISTMMKSLDGSDYLEFRVQDTGTGIKEQDQECLFKLFGVLEDNEDLNPNGCGLGLTISKKYVELLGGEIRCQSVYKEGTEMIFTILVHDTRRISPNEAVLDINDANLPLNLIESMSGSEFKVNEEYDSNLRAVNQLHTSRFNSSKFQI
ncbi:unnamed protein product [Moneuplotes crassus]|uniref:histidine kinase n=1 Tax=Euplotes crassus TaxID=5936 RepID=A0AAD1UK13_EUPCR|nr:unnamed protein product [Moneuplotes crassus]